MKRFYIALVAMLTVSVAVAQPVQRKMGKFSPKPSPVGRLAYSASTAASAIITEQPEGTLHERLYRASCYMCPYQFPMVNANTYDGYISGMEGKYVEGTDGNIYIYEALTYPSNGAWVKASRADGDTLVVKMQPIYEEDGVTYYINRLKIDIQEDGKWWAADKDCDELKYLLRNDSLILCDDGLVDGYARTMAGLTDADGNWYGYAEWSTVSAPCKVKVNTPPVTATEESYTMTRYDADGVEYQLTVKLAIDAEDFYIGGFYKGTPECWIKGHRKEGLVIFPANQYLGFDTTNRMHLFFRPVDPNGSSIATMGDSLAYAYDEESRKLSTKDKFYINIGNEGLLLPAYGTSSVCYNATWLEPYTEVSGTPKPVEIADDYCFPYDANDAVPEGRIAFYLPELTTDGNRINADKAYYNVYFNDQLYTFRSDKYKNVSEEEGLTNIPFDYSDGLDFQQFGKMHYIWLYEPVDRVGIQVIYEGGGTTNKSEIVTHYFNVTGINAVNIVAHSDCGVVYDLLGRRISGTPQKGIYIKAGKKFIVR